MPDRSGHEEGCELNVCSAGACTVLVTRRSQRLSWERWSEERSASPLSVYPRAPGCLWPHHAHHAARDPAPHLRLSSTRARFNPVLRLAYMWGGNDPRRSLCSSRQHSGGWVYSRCMVSWGGRTSG